MAKSGIKRASPGAEKAKNPLSDVELSDEDAAKLNVVQKDIARAELMLERRAQLSLIPVYERRRAVLKTIPHFWAVALLNHPILGFHAQHSSDKQALTYLEDLWVSRDPNEPRCYTVELYFKENPYFNDAVLKKEFKHIATPASADEKPDADGITESMLEFSWERDVAATAMKIDWKDSSKALTKLYPREAGEDGDDIPAEAGSFFNFFELEADPFEIGLLIGNEVFPEAIDYFLGRGGDEWNSDDEEDDSDDQEEIDLEKPKVKKQKV